MPVFSLSPRERAVYRRFAGLALPRHTSYPSAPLWTADYGPNQCHADLVRAARNGRPLALYVHIPFCAKLCYYCACTKEIVPEVKRREHDPASELPAGLDLEMQRLLGRLLVRVVAAVFDRYLPRDAYLVGLPGKSASQVG